MASLRTKYEPIARNAAKGAGIDPDLFVRQITQESGWADDVIDCRRASSAGAQGIAQIVARFHPNVNPCDPVAALEYAAQLMRNHLAVWNGDWALALSAYNAGPGATASGVKGQLAGWPYAETVGYVANILQVGQDEARRRLTGGSPMPSRVTYNKHEPVHPQEDSFDCSQESLEWALYALGRKPAEDWLEPTMIAEGVMSPGQGLLDASGAGLAAFVRRHYGEFGYDANHEPSISWDWIVNEGGHAYPVMIGGRGWHHWTAVRDYDPARDVLLLANPADGWMGVKQTMDKATFDALGPFSAVRVWHPDLLGPARPTPPPPPPPTLTAGQIRAKLLELVAMIPEGAP